MFTQGYLERVLKNDVITSQNQKGQKNDDPSDELRAACNVLNPTKEFVYD